MIKKLAYAFTLALFVGSSAFAQDGAKVEPHDVVMMVKVAENNPSNMKILTNAKYSKIASSESNTEFYMVCTKDQSESAKKELSNIFGKVAAKVIEMDTKEYLEKHSK